MTFRQYFEGTVSADIAGTSGGFEKECPCKTDPDSEECKKIRKKKQLDESPVGSVGRTGSKDAEEYINSTPELRAEFKKIVRKLGGVTVARKLLMQMNTADQPRVDEVFITRLVNDAKKKLQKMGYKNLKYMNFRDYNLSKEKLEEIPCSHSGYTIYLVKRKDGAFFDVLPSGTF